ncbi:disease resistance protein RML1A isoform X4 [Jatropha curcas]|uniref:disease resistance protein RML1A isoform X4 n=1 Tax=Jatropha curcas TaxID=180498 RepID=UPI00189515B1|nr:disease resistance protein RML1A isoform X4 [Jatropha curcas]
MASSSSVRSIKYDVFLSFRGADTRHSFVSHLYGYLHDRLGIPTFIDNRLERGEEIEPAILKAIEDSHISVIIFSKNYASSPWCLDEVVKIFQCKDEFGQKVIPVFYHVDPTDVYNQTGSFAEDFAKHDQDFKDRVQNWRVVLSRAAYISGEVLTESKSEYQLVQDAVKGILNILRDLHPSNVQNLIGLESQIKRVESLLSGEDDDVRIVGIWGMGGIGKTTLARVVFEKFSSHFDNKCFLENVREKSLQACGLAKLEEELVVQIFGERNKYQTPKIFLSKLHYKKILLVLDDVDDFDKIKFAQHSQFGPGSRIIITSRDKEVFEKIADEIYEVEALSEHGALQLFSFYAFKENQPETSFVELSESVVRYAKGIPLVVIVLGSHLYNKSKEEWKIALKKFETSLKKKVESILKISYDGLDYKQQQIFLHIACFFKGEPRSRIEELLDACGFSTLIDLTILKNRSLINISGNNKVMMHDLLQQMGHEIVGQESAEPGKRSRLCNHDDVHHVLTKKTGTESVEGMFLDQTKINTLSLDPAVFSNMIGMKFLKFHDSSVNEDEAMYRCYKKCLPNYFDFPQGLESLPGELRLLTWQYCPLKALPSNFDFEKLVEINLFGSRIERLWSGAQALPSLKEISMSECRFLVEMPDFSGAPNLKAISCQGCIRLLDVSPSIQCLNKLSFLNLGGCKGIMSLPSTKNLSSLEQLRMDGCQKINKFPEVPTTIQVLLLAWTAIEDIPSSIGSLSQLRILDIHGCNKLKSLSNVLFQLELETIAVSGPYVYASVFANELCRLSSLRELLLRECDFESIPSTIKQLSSLRKLCLCLCNRLQSLPELPPGLRDLDASHCISLQAVSSSMELIEEGWGHFCFVDCANLDWEEFRSHVPQRILHLAHKTLESHRGLENSDEKQYRIIFPGYSIPNWIQHQDTGFSITLPLPPNWYENFLGFALSAVLCIGNGTHDHVEKKYLRLECQFKSNYGESYPKNARFSFYECATDSSLEQVLMFYNSDFCLEATDKGERMVDYNEVSFGFFMENADNNPIASTVQKCGVRLLYEGNDIYVHNQNEAFNFQQNRTYSSDKHKVESNVVGRRKRKYKKFLSPTMMRLKPIKYFSLWRRKRMRENQGEHLALKKRKRGSKRDNILLSHGQQVTSLGQIFFITRIN